MTVRVRINELKTCLWSVKGPGNCRSCGAPILWAETDNGKLMPVDKPETESATTVSHFSTCPTAKKWRR